MMDPHQKEMNMPGVEKVGDVYIVTKTVKTRLGSFTSREHAEMFRKALVEGGQLTDEMSAAERQPPASDAKDKTRAEAIRQMQSKGNIYSVAENLGVSPFTVRSWWALAHKRPSQVNGHG